MFLFQLQTTAPSGEAVLEYDRRHLLTYAELLDAADTGLGWQARALEILGVDPTVDPDRASHLARARWIVADGLEEAIEAFGALPRTFGRTA